VSARAARSQRIRIHALAAAVVSSETTPPQIEQLYQNTFANRVRTREGAMVSRRNADELDGLRRDPVEDLRRQGESTVVCLAGEIDLYNAEAVRKALRKACTGAGTVVVDLSSVEFADSTTIGILLEARSRLGGRPLKLVGPPPQVIHALELCGVDGRLPIYATLADALSA
jgi:anti-anti-sigma factor